MQILGYMLINGFFGILLHSGIDGSIDFQTIYIKIIIGTIFLFILCTPTVQRVSFPSQRVFIILLHLPATVIAPVRFTGSHYATQVFTEIGSQSVFMIDRLKFQHQRKSLQGVTFFLSKETCLTHLVKNCITAATGTFIKTTGIIKRRVLTHTNQGSGLFYFQIFGVFSKISLGCSFNTYSIIQEIELIKIHGKDFFLCVITFQLYSNYPLNRFLQQTLHYVISCG